jgi:lactate permease
MDDTQLPIDVLRWSLALLPIVVLLVLMVQLRWTAPQAGPMGMFAAAAIALLVFRTPWETLAVAGAKGVWDAHGRGCTCGHSSISQSDRAQCAQRQ